MAKKNDTIEVTEKSEALFRLFNKIEYNDVKVPEEWGDAVFSIRPMNNTERALFDLEEEKIAIARDVSGATERNELTADDYEDVDGKRVLKAGSTSKMMSVLKDFKIDTDAEEQYFLKVKEYILKCVRTVTHSGETQELTEKLYEALNGSALRMWLLKQVKDAGSITEEEVLSL